MQQKRIATRTGRGRVASIKMDLNKTDRNKNGEMLTGSASYVSADPGIPWVPEPKNNKKKDKEGTFHLDFEALTNFLSFKF